jgi:putative transposase
MPRHARLDFEGCLHHLINRGIERRILFLDRTDYETFIELLETVITEGKHRCYGWVLMPNHFHLLVETGRELISKMMSSLKTKYALKFNRRHRRAGVLFQNRFKSVVCEKDTYFQELLAYIHLNPLRARLVPTLESLESDPWSGHGALLGKTEVAWQSVEETLAHFGKRVSGARKSYLEFMANHRDMRSGELSGGGLMRVMRTRQDRDFYDTRVLAAGGGFR